MANPVLLHGRRLAHQRGVTLVELMIALVLGALVVLAATAMVVSSRSTYRSQDESTRISESARFGVELTNRLVRLTGYTNYGNPNGATASTPPSGTTPPAGYTPDVLWPSTNDAFSLDGPNLVGANSARPDGGTVINNSDALTIRFYGSNAVAGGADGNILDCAGVPVPEPRPDFTTDITVATRRARAYNVLFVGNDSAGEPSLMCRRQTFDATGAPSGLPGDTQVLIRGVEDFQVIYGELLPQTAPNNDLDLFPAVGVVWRTGIGGTNPPTDWANVRAVRIAMLLRSATGARAEPEPVANTYHLFGPDYPATNDHGADFPLSGLSAAERTRVRRVVQTTIFVRNRVAVWPNLQFD
jgi:type IV pilus assembly protein PilW